MKRKLPLISLALAVAGVYTFRRQLVDVIAGLPVRERYEPVGAELGISIPMQDGTLLKADHYFPKTGRLLPAILVRSYYGRGADLGPQAAQLMGAAAKLIARRGYHVIIQTTRGRLDSGGDDYPFIHEVSDGGDTLQWISRQPWSDGQAGMWGNSYLGYVQLAAALSPQGPATLKAIVPVTISSNLYSLIYPGGAFGLDTFLNWASLLETIDQIGEPRSTPASPWQPAPSRPALGPAFFSLPLEQADQAAFERRIDFFHDWLEHPQAADPYWKQLDLNERLIQIGIPVHLVAGWQDLFLAQQLEDYAALCQAGRQPYLTIGPWTHSDPQVMLESLRQALAWFDTHLKGDPSNLRVKPVRVFVQGAADPGWRDLEAWPPPTHPETLYLQDARRLGLLPGGPKSPPDRYVYNPANPTPSVGGPLLQAPAGQLDNAALESRPDVLVYSLPPLSYELEVLGKPRVELFVHTSRPHTDFVARLCDVDSTGRSLNVTDGFVRLAPGQGQLQADGSLKITIELWPTAYRFGVGHRVRLLLASGGHPRWNRNAGTGDPEASALWLESSTQTVYHDETHPSVLILPVG